MSEPQSSGGSEQGLFARIANSAEYSIAAALIAVCLVVGGALWWLRPQGTAAPEVTVASTSARPAAPAVDENAAVDDWKRRLDEQFSAIDEQQRQRVVDEDARRARQRAEEAAVAEGRRHADLAAQARQQEAKARERAAKPAPTQVATLPRRAPVRTDAAIDWSSCKRPPYPQLSVKRNEEGVVVATVDLDPSGQIQQIHLTQSSGHARLDRVTLEAIRKCRFTPAREDGITIAASAEVRLNWQLKE